MENKITAAMDLTVEMTVSLLSEELNKSKDEILIDFMKSNTCKMLYNDKCKLWWDGPAAIAEEYKAEMSEKGTM
ncbi:MAG: hypothetical protein K5873_11365 [Treponema sp.]|nr:hypothetical protein [Treponema sp.]